MRKNIIIAALLAISALALVRIVHQVRGTTRITPMVLEELTGAGLVAGLGGGDAAGVLVVVDEIRPGIPDYTVRMAGVTKEAVRLGFPETSIAVEKWPVDPMHRQMGQADFGFENLFSLLAKHPGIRHVVLMLDVANPGAAARDTARTKGLVISLLTNNEAGGRQLHENGGAKTVFFGRTAAPQEPPPAAFQDKRFEPLHHRFVILTSP